MTTKADFNAEEWSTVAEGPLFAGLRVAAAARGGTLRESMAMGKVYVHARQQHGDSQLLDELVAAPPAVDAQRLGSPEQLEQLSQERLQQAVAILEQKASAEDVDAYKRFVLSVAQAAAEAHKEGGVLGIGGERVSEAERAALDAIVATLGTGAA